MTYSYKYDAWVIAAKRPDGRFPGLQKVCGDPNGNPVLYENPWRAKEHLGKIPGDMRRSYEIWKVTVTVEHDIRKQDVGSAVVNDNEKPWESESNC